MYYVVTDSDGDHVRTVEADFADEAVQAVEAGGQHEGTLHAREARQDEAFRYLVDQTGLSHAGLAQRLDVTEGYIGHRMRGDRDVRRLDVLALERFIQLQERNE